MAASGTQQQHLQRQQQQQQQQWQHKGRQPPQQQQQHLTEQRQRQRQRHQPLRALLPVLLAVLALAACARPAAGVLLSHRPGNVLTMILTDCAKYQDWQTIAAAFAWRQSDQPGSVVRVANCNEKDTVAYDKRMLDYVQTHMAKQYAWYEPLKDWYAAYNKPGAVVDYFEHNNPPEEWVVVLDSDMLLKRSFVPDELPLERGWAYAAHYDYLVGVDNALAMRHVPEVPPRNDTIAGNVGRRGDRVGGPYYMHRDDLRKLAPQWLNYTRIMRDDMEAYKDSGDTASKKGDRIWIAEMYGYSFGAAKSDVWHKWKHNFMLYPSYTPPDIPYVMHYGLIYRVYDWQYDKHWYFDFDVHQCPPWPKSDKPKAGIFPPPPYPDKLPNKDYLTQYRDLLSVSVISVVNAAMCDYHVRNCPPSAELTEVCDEAFKLYHAIDSEVKEHEWRWKCTDHNKECKMWADRGECEKSKAYMKDHCQVSCKYCAAPGLRPQSTAEVKHLTVAGISQEIGVVHVPAGSKDAPATAAAGSAPPPPPPSPSPAAAGGADAAAQAQAQRKQSDAAAKAVAAAKAAGDKAANTKADAGSKGQATAGQAAAGATKVATAAEVPSEEELRAKYPTTTLSYSALVKRCTDLQGVDEAGLKVCLKAASYKLVFPGTLKAGSKAAAAAGDKETGGGTQAAGQGKDAGGGAQDLASLHALYHGGAGSGSRSSGKRGGVENLLRRTAVAAEGGWGFAEQAFLAVALLGVCVFGYSRWQRYQASRAKAHSRSE